MNIKKITAVIMAAVVMISVLSCGFVAAALIICETQFTYDSANPSWLKDLIIKEDMNNVDGLSQRNTLVAKPQYPYRATAESFKKEVESYETLYTLDENMANVAYLYMLELAMSFAGSVDEGYSDEFIRSYLESVGIVYPEEETAETAIVARAFFSIITSDENFVVERGTGLNEAFISYVSKLLGVNLDSVIKFDEDTKLTDLKEYVLAACKFMLFSAGYNVGAGTSDEELYRLIAIMTIRSQGITIDTATATFEEIKNKYLCAMMCKIYDVSIDTNGFGKAVENDNLAFYMLQLVGKENGVTVRDSESYSNAFDIICKNTKYFDLEEGEFYADISEYDVKLNYKRENIWIYPQTLSTTSESDGITVNVFINDQDVRENYYVKIAIDKEATSVPVTIRVEVTDKTGAKVSSTYKVNVIQGTKEPVEGTTISGALDSMKDYVDKVVGDLGMDSSIADIVQKIPFKLPERILSIASLLLPSIGSGSLTSDLLSLIFGYSKDDDSHVDTDSIGGVGGLDAFEQSQSQNSSQSMDFGQLNLGNLNFNTDNLQKPMNPADTVIVPDAQIVYPDNTNEPQMNWFEEIISDPVTVVVLIVILVSTFVICLGVFLRLFSMKNTRKSNQKNK